MSTTESTTEETTMTTMVKYGLGTIEVPDEMIEQARADIATARTERKWWADGADPERIALNRLLASRKEQAENERAQAVAEQTRIAVEQKRRDAEDDASWYSLVMFGLPSAHAVEGSTYGRGRRERDRLVRMAQEAMGTGTCSATRVVRCDSEAVAKAADISDASLAVEFCA